MNDGSLKGQAALVTGGSRGIGFAIAQRLQAHGANVCITARNEPTLHSAIDELDGETDVFAVAGDTADAAHQQSAVAEAVSRWGRLDILVNNTGINPAYGSLIDVDDDTARRIIDVNVLSTLSWTRTAWRAHMHQHGGVVVNVASVAGLRPATGIGLYGASKAALLHLSQQLAIELAPRVRVNAVAPAVIRTRFATPLYAGREHDITSDYPAARLGEPHDVAAAVAYLASPDAGWITGQTLVVDGGLTLGGGVR